jgi:hypothetical protein
MQPNIGYDYPKDFLGQLVFADDQIANKVNESIKESKCYQKLALEKMGEIYLEYSRVVTT